MNTKGPGRRTTISMEPSPALSYVIGCYLSDGCLSEYRGQCQFILVTTDKPYAESFVAAWTLLGRKPYVRHVERPTASKSSISLGFLDQAVSLKPSWRVVVGCKDFHDWVSTHSTDELLDLALARPWRFLCGLYEGDGSVFWKRGRKGIAQRLALTVLFNTDLVVIGRVRSWLEANGYHPCVYTKGKGRKQPIAEIRLGRQDEVRSFLKNAAPSIKVLPRSHVNTEPSLQPTQEGVETR